MYTVQKKIPLFTLSKFNMYVCMVTACVKRVVTVHSPVNQDEWEKACLYVLHNAKKVKPFIEVHMMELRM